MPRIPLPFKLLLSYLCIVTIGAGPTFVYVRAKLQDDLMADAAALLVSRGRRMARVLGNLSASDRLAQLRQLGDAGVERLTYLSPRGEVLFDSEVPDSAHLENHIGRPEIRYALGDLSAPRADFSGQLHGAEGVGVYRRVSETTHIDTLYIALRVTTAHDETIGVLRMATPVDRIQNMTTGTMHFARNAQALAVSLAIGFSLLAALLIVRPLQRVNRMVQSLAAGDIAAQVGRLGNDEVGDVGRALERMAMTLRRKLLAAGLGEALLSQLVEALPTPCVAFEEGGEVVAINGAARRCLGIEGQAAGRRMKEFAEHPAVLQALSTAEYEGEPEPLHVSLPWQQGVRGNMHVLKRPGMAPLRVFIGEPTLASPGLPLPVPEQIQPQELAAVLQAALGRAEAMLERRGVSIQEAGPASSSLVAEAQGRLAAAIEQAIDGCAAVLEGRKQALSLSTQEEPLRLRVVLGAALGNAEAEQVRKLLEPLGGAVELLSAETHLWLPRA